jgi:hypothetical protein
MELIVVNPGGIEKQIVLDRAIYNVGSAPSNHIQLPSFQVAPLHMQILASPELPTGCRVVNLAGELMVRRNQNEQPLVNYRRFDLWDGDEIRLGDFRLIYQSPLKSAVIQSTSSFQASLLFPEPILHPASGIDGLLKLLNKGGAEACHFQVKVSGIPEECFLAPPIPFLNPGVQQELGVRLIHRTVTPLAGYQTVGFHITAPEEYPGETLVIEQGIYVMPVFQHSLDIVDDREMVK